jgi:hypothetical protein
MKATYDLNTIGLQDMGLDEAEPVVLRDHGEAFQERAENAGLTED